MCVRLLIPKTLHDHRRLLLLANDIIAAREISLELYTYSTEEREKELSSDQNFQ